MGACVQPTSVAGEVPMSSSWMVMGLPDLTESNLFSGYQCVAHAVRYRALLPV